MDSRHRSDHSGKREPALGLAANLAAHLMDAPLASILLRGAQSDTFYFSDFDGPANEIESLFREAAFAEPAGLVVKDASKDSRFKDHPAVLGGVRFAAAAPVLNADGSRLGTLAVYDFTPRSFTASHRKDLAYFAKLIASQLQWMPVIGLDSAFAKSPIGSGEAVYTQDLNGRILEANSSFESATGYLRSSLIGMNCSDLLLPESAAALKRFFVSILGGESTHPIDLTFVRRNGNPVTLEVRGARHYGTYPK
jgi:PAS domain S-box-containing protein